MRGIGGTVGTVAGSLLFSPVASTPMSLTILAVLPVKGDLKSACRLVGVGDAKRRSGNLTSGMSLSAMLPTADWRFLRAVESDIPTGVDPLTALLRRGVEP